MTAPSEPTCPFCRLPFTLLPGCTAPEAEDYALPHDGHEVDEPCRDCAAHPGAQHHVGCCCARCPRTDSQALFCTCPTCGPVNSRLFELMHP